MTILEQFEQFWKLYDKQVKRWECEHLWSRMTQEDRDKTIAHVPAYVASTPDKKYRKDPATYLFNEGWNDEIIVKAPDPKAPPATYVKPEPPKAMTAYERYLAEKEEVERKQAEFYKNIKEAQQKQKPVLGLGDRIKENLRRLNENNQ